ncbi:MAG: hypothetical protein M1294_03530 [Firmicutes bacterium]|uniref:Uncharacterized protein n=1 Tax=Sulfobacillus benefaciens TaxID=453960 RepID=A0A2T2XB33_9FIRM|nr:hypothetical protein [Bacillota bacterium]MCL5015823.1 hypothetical protein [Bacillota bacterium]PSR31721.1 MAG: hypothetical protein C7B43_00395 [Sulfobacillus benefaciens]
MTKNMLFGVIAILLPWLAACGSTAYLVPAQGRQAPQGVVQGQQAVEQRVKSIDFNLTRAIATEESVLAHDPTYALGYSKLAQLFWDNHEPGAAIEEAQKACRLQPGNVIFWTNLGQLCLVTHHLNQANEAFTEALSHDAGNWAAYVGLGQVALALHNAAQAKVDGAEALKFGGPQGPIFVLDGQLNQQENNWRNAATFYHDAISANPNWWQGYYDLAVVEIHWGEISAAIRDLHQALTDNPGSSAVWLLLQSLPRTRVP